jgi:hypothetical protein
MRSTPGPVPVITELQAIQGACGTWTISGSVLAVSDLDLTVALSFPDGEAQTVTCDNNGNFNIVLTLPGNISGEMTAVATDINGQQSQQAESLL